MEISEELWNQWVRSVIAFSNLVGRLEQAAEHFPTPEASRILGNAQSQLNYTSHREWLGQTTLQILEESPVTQDRHGRAVLSRSAGALVRFVEGLNSEPDEVVVSEEDWALLLGKHVEDSLRKVFPEFAAGLPESATVWPSLLDEVALRRKLAELFLESGPDLRNAFGVLICPAGMRNVASIYSGPLGEFLLETVKPEHHARMRGRIGEDPLLELVQEAKSRASKAEPGGHVPEPHILGERIQTMLLHARGQVDQTLGNAETIPGFTKGAEAAFAIELALVRNYRKAARRLAGCAGRRTDVIVPLMETLPPDVREKVESFGLLGVDLDLARWESACALVLEILDLDPILESGDISAGPQMLERRRRGLLDVGEDVRPLRTLDDLVASVRKNLGPDVLEL